MRSAPSGSRCLRRGTRSPTRHRKSGQAPLRMRASPRPSGSRFAVLPPR
jgi:hypothetical protein